MLPIPYNTLVVLAGAAALGGVSGALGCHLVLRRRALIGDAMSHAALPGLCAAFLLSGTRDFAVLLSGAFASALFGAWAVGWITRHTRVKEDAAIGIVLSVLFGAGVSLSRIVQNSRTDASKAGLDSFLFGKTAGMVLQDVYFILGVAAVVAIALVALHKEFKLLSFDADFASVQGWPVGRIDAAMLALACATTIIGLPAVGVALMAAMLVIPGAAARFWTARLSTMVALSAGFGVATGALGAIASAWRESLPAGPIIVLVGTAIFVVSMLFAPERGIVARALRRGSLRREIGRAPEDFGTES